MKDGPQWAWMSDAPWRVTILILMGWRAYALMSRISAAIKLMAYLPSSPKRPDSGQLGFSLAAYEQNQAA
jgi:hypothetical protein